MKHILFSAGISLALFATPALASNFADSSTLKQCLDNSGGVTTQMRGCLAAEIELWDTRRETSIILLEPLLKKRTSQQSEDPVKVFAAARTAWQSYRENHCGWYFGRTGGTIDFIDAASCWLELTAHRALELETLLELELTDR